MGKKISVFRENDVEYLKDYLVEAVREVLYAEQESVLIPTGIKSGGPAMDFAGVGSSAEGAEVALVYGMNNRSVLGGDFQLDEEWYTANVLTAKAMKDVDTDTFLRWVKIGVACGNAGSVGSAETFGAGKCEDLKDPSLNATPKTDIKIDGLQVSVKDSDAGYQAEAIEANSFKDLFGGAFEIFKSGNPDKEYLQNMEPDNISNFMKDVLEGYRSGEEKGEKVNALLGLKGGGDISPEDSDQLAEELKIASYNILLENFTMLFKDPDFKREFCKQAVTGQYKFKEGNECIATHILYFSPSSVQFEVKKLSEEYITEMATHFEWQVRTGRRKAAPASSDKMYAAKKGAVTKKISKVAKAFGTSPDKVLDALLSQGIAAKGKADKHGQPALNQHDYEALRYLSDSTDKKWAKALIANKVTLDDYITQVLEKFKSGETYSDEDGFKGFKGRSGRFATDVAGKKYTAEKITDPSTGEEIEAIVWKNEAGDEKLQVSNKLLKTLKKVLSPEETSRFITGKAKALRDKGWTPVPHLKGAEGSDFEGDDGEQKFMREELLEEGWLGDALKKVASWGSKAVDSVKKWLSAKGSQLLDFLGFKIGTHQIKHPKPELTNTFEK